MEQEMEQETQKSPELRMTPEVSAAAIADRCRKDDEFLNNLCADPKAVLAEASGKSIPEGMNVVVHRNSGDHWHIAIPSDEQAKRLGEAFKAIDSADSPLSDEQLTAVSGGIFEIWIAALVIAGSVAATGALVGGLIGGSGAQSSVQS